MSWLIGQRWNEVEKLVYQAIQSKSWLTDNYRFLYKPNQYDFKVLSNNMGEKVVRLPMIVDGEMQVIKFFDDWTIQPVLNSVNLTVKRTGIVDQLDNPFVGAIPNRFYNIWAGLSRSYDSNNNLIPYIFLTAQHLASIDTELIPSNTAGFDLALSAGNRNNKYQFTVGSEAFIWSTTDNTFNTCTITDIRTDTHAVTPILKIDTHNEFYSGNVTGNAEEIFIVQINNQMPYVIPETLASVDDRQTYPESLPAEKYNSYYLIDSFIQGSAGLLWNAIADMGAGFKRLAFSQEIFNDNSPLSVPIFLPNIVPINSYRTRFDFLSTLLEGATGFDLSIDCPGSALNENFIVHNVHEVDHQFGQTVERPFMDCLPMLRIQAPDQSIVMNMKGFYSGKPFYESNLPTII